VDVVLDANMQRFNFIPSHMAGKDACGLTNDFNIGKKPP
jgi:hypothetical protein